MTQSNAAPWGATADDWAHFAQLGLTEDLLPVVSNPRAVIAPGSRMRDLGKTPSQYNRDRQVVGIPQWTAKHTTDREVGRWCRDSDLGICLQTRLVRAIDIDIPDAEQAQRVRDAVELYLEAELPVRWRADSGKCLLVFRMPGEFRKRILRTAHGAVEFLATGQQFVAVGTHPAGARYQWGADGRLPDEIPELTPAQFEGLWLLLAQQFALESVETRAGQRPSMPRRVDDVNDPVVAWLDANGWVEGYQRDGRVEVRCPWEHEHTSDTGPSATVWFPAGLGGIAKGNFRCLHAHCAGRDADEFLDEVGYTSAQFDVVPVGGAGGARAGGAGDGGALDGEPPPLPVFQRKRSGEILANVHNLNLALRRADVCGVHIAYDGFTDAIVMAPRVDNIHEAQWQPLTDADYTELRVRLERVGFGPIGREIIRDVVLLVARDQHMDSAIEWLTHRVPAWDGVPRVERFWSRYFRCDDTPYTRAVGVYTWTALAGRVLDPGCKVDMVPVLIGREGTGKTTGVAALAPSEQYFAQLALNTRDDDLSRRMRGVLVGELAELRGLHTRDREAILDWITRRYERWTPKYREFDTTFPRRLLLIGTTNEERFLDETGGEDRRWLPLRVGDTDMAALVADRDQLWAEARDLWRRDGVLWREVYGLAGAVRGDHRLQDPWADLIWQWLQKDDMEGDDGVPRGLKPVRSLDLLVSALGVPPGRVTRSEEVRIGRVLRAFGYERKTARFEGRPVAAWYLQNDARSQFFAGRLAKSTEDLV